MRKRDKQQGGKAITFKTGEIFRHKGEWYQAVSGSNCKGCVFHTAKNACNAECRYMLACLSVKEPKVFHKLEPIMTFWYYDRLTERYHIETPAILPDVPYVIYNEQNKTVDIPIMEE